MEEIDGFLKEQRLEADKKAGPRISGSRVEP